MTEQTVWMIGGGAALAGLLVGWLLGRAGGRGSQERHLAQLEEELKAERARMHEFRHQVDNHFDRTASLFASIAGSYKELFEHLSSGYDKLTTTPTRDRLRERVGGLLGQSPPRPDGRQTVPPVATPVPSPGVRQVGSDTPPPLATRLTMREGAPPPAATAARKVEPAPAAMRKVAPAASAARKVEPLAPVPAPARKTDPAVTTGLIRDALEGRTRASASGGRVEPGERLASAPTQRPPVPGKAATQPTSAPKSAAPAPTVSLRR